jgi:bacterioferritin-associated ferredoxin
MALVCHCEAVRERAIVKAIRRGATSLADVTAACRAGSQCGGCHPVIEQLLAEHARPSPTASLTAASA